LTNSSHPSPDQELLARVSRAVEPAYDIERELGRGGSGIVYRATDRRLKRSVALKILPPDLAFRADTRERFMREAETAARLSHPNIVPIFSVDERDGLAWFVMAIVEGENVGERVRSRGAIPFDDVRRIMREVADALAYAHERGVVHRDIKPDNILIDGQTSRALVTDFGIARATTEGESRLTATGTAIGTPAYMSPEQCAGERQLDGRSDLYSLGAVAYYAITGQPPFDGPSTPVIMMKQVTELPKPMSRYRSGIPQDLDAIIMRLLEKDPADRFASGSELIAALDGAPVTPARKKKSRMDTLGTFSMPPMPPMFKPVPMMNPSWMIPGGRMLERHKRHEDRMQRREAKENARPLPDRIRSFRRHLASYVGTTTFLFAINAVTGPDFWWAVFPAMGMMMGLMNEGGGLWAAGARLSDVFGSSKPLAAGSTNPPLPAAAATTPGPGEITAEVLAGPRGSVARQAGADRRAIKDLVSRMSKSERDMLPDVEQTAENLYERIAELGRALHRLDAEMDPKKLPELNERISQTEKVEGTEADRRLRLLRRQREMMASLLESRDKLAEQYESAGLLLQNLKLDLIRMRSSGLQSGLAEVTSATQEARALSREIGYVLAAADELKDIDRDR
jgi:serine/threonine protein kinase